MDRRESAALDRHITGNYGEDQFADQDWPDDPECQVSNCHEPAEDGVLCEQHNQQSEEANR